MKNILQFALVLTAITVTAPSSAQSLLGLDLGNLVTSGGGSGLVSLDTSGGNLSVGTGGTQGASINLPTGGTTGASNSIGLAGVLEVSASPTDGGGSGVGISVLGSDPQSNSLNPLGLLGGGGGIGVGVPNLGGITGGGGGGGNGGGGNGGTGGNAGNPVINIFASTGPGGGNGGAGGNGLIGGRGGDGGSFAIPSGISSRLQALLRVLAQRNFLRLANGKAVCLTSFGVAEVASTIPQKDWRSLQQALTNYSEDIYTLRQMLANCRSASQRQALNISDLNRVIGIDIQGGQPVLLML